MNTTDEPSISVYGPARAPVSGSPLEAPELERLDADGGEPLPRGREDARGAAPWADEEDEKASTCRGSPDGAGPAGKPLTRPSPRKRGEGTREA